MHKTSTKSEDNTPYEESKGEFVRNSHNQIPTRKILNEIYSQSSEYT